MSAILPRIFFFSTLPSWPALSVVFELPVPDFLLPLQPTSLVLLVVIIALLVFILQKYRLSRKNEAVILMYHSISSPETDPWGISVSPAHFEEQMEVLQKNYKVVSLDQLEEYTKANRIPAKTVCITFDDAYTNNLLVAKPVLERLRLTATFFVPSGLIGQGEGFWWDELELTILHSNLLPASIEVNINNHHFLYGDIETQLTAELRELQRSWRWEQPPTTRRCELFLEIWKSLQPLPANVIRETLTTIKAWAGNPAPVPQAEWPMSLEQLTQMHRQPLFQLEVHTVSHPALAMHTPEAQSGEINDCFHFLEHLRGSKPTKIAFPYGSFNEASIEIARAAGITTAYITKPETIKASTDPFRRGRFQVMDLDGAAFRKALQSWF